MFTLLSTSLLGIGSPLLYFSDAVLRAPTIGSMLMCLAASLVGVVVFLRKESLLGEALSHACYPGVILGILLAAWLLPDDQESLNIAVAIIGGAFFSALAGLWVIRRLELRLRVGADAALAFVLATFFGLGLTLASRVQVTHTHLYRQIEMYLYGQAATMTDMHIAVYGALALLVIISICALYKELQVVNFDRSFARSIGMHTRGVESYFFLLMALSVVIGIRCVGVVLMSSMLIGPAVAARQLTHRLHWMFVIAGLIGLLSGFLGNYLSVEISHWLNSGNVQDRFALPTGPMIVLVSSGAALLALLFAKDRGLLLRVVRMAAFRFRCMQENLLKALWKTDAEAAFSKTELRQQLPGSRLRAEGVIWSLTHQGWLQRGNLGFVLTEDGKKRAAHIVRLHRLWEVYLVSELGIAADRVHASAEEVEHIITPEIERKLVAILNDPQWDPHHQPIPPSISEIGTRELL